MAVLWTNGMDDLKFYAAMRGALFVALTWFIVRFILRYPEMPWSYIAIFSLFPLGALLFFINGLVAVYNPMIVQTEGIRLPVRVFGILTWKNRVVRWEELRLGKLYHNPPRALWYYSQYTLIIQLKNGESFLMRIVGEDGEEERRNQFAKIWEAHTKAPIWNPQGRMVSANFG